MAEISNHELVRMLRRYAKWLKDKSDNSFQKNQNLWKLILLAAERLYQYEQYQEETDAYKQGEWDMFEQFEEDVENMKAVIEAERKDDGTLD